MTIETGAQSQTDMNTAFLRAARAGQLEKILSSLNTTDIDINVSNANGLNAMHLASKDGHSEVVSVLLQRGAHIDAATKKGNTALHIAALAGQESVVRLLVEHGAQINIQSQNGFTPLYMAAQENHDSVVRFLLSSGANQSLATEDGFTPLAVAMQQGHEKVVAVLLEADTGRVRLPALHIAAKKDDCKAAALLLENDHNPDVTSKSGFTPLHIAAHYGNEAVAKLLLAKGADVNCAAKHNITPLHVAAKWGKTNMVALLTENGAHVEARTRDGLTPLHCAARSGHEHVVDMLLERGAPISGKSKNGLAPLHMAAQGDHSDAARILLYHRAPVDDLTVDYLTALHVAAHCGHVKVAKLLLDRNADANARALNGFTPLHIACKKNRIKVVELLLKYGASISATTESGLTPLHVAAFMGCMNIVIYLLQHEASPDVPTVRGETPLHLAARANQTDIIRILLRNGAAVDARAREMQTALHIASRLGNVDIVLLLVQHGAQLDALTSDNYNALHIAAKQHNHEVAAVLLEHGAPPNAVTKKGFTPLHLAAKYGNLKVANLLMSQKNAELDPRGKNGVTPLHVAAQYKHHAVATALLEKGADPKAAAKNGHTALHIAARKNQMETAAALMEKGAVVDAESKAGCTPLHLAAHQGQAEMCSLLIEQGADPGKKAKSGLAALHLAAQEDHVAVAKILVNNGAKVDVGTKGGYTPLHVASHFGQTNMVKFLLENGANVQATTCHGYTALHHAAQQGHINIVNLLLEHKADANATTNNGQTPLDIAQRLGYVTVMDTLKIVSLPNLAIQPKDDKYKPVAPETMYETFMSDSEEEGGEDTMLTDQPYRYLTVDDMKSLGDDSLPIDVTKDERIESIIIPKSNMEISQDLNGPQYAVHETVSKEISHLYNTEKMKEGYCYNVDATQPKRKLQWKNFLVSFLVDARGGALRGCRGGGVRVIVPPLSAQQPTRITCRYVRSQRISHMPPLMEGEALASRILELGPVSAKFIGPIIIEVPHFASLRGKEREIVILRSDNGTTWREHAVEAADCTIQDILSDTLDIDDLPEESGTTPRMTRILTHDFPQYFAIISRIRQEVHAIGPEGGMVSSSVVPQVQAVFPQGALTKKIKVGLQAQTIEPDLTAKLLGRGVAVSPVVTVEPRRRKFHKAITLSMPAPRPHSQGMINQYTTSAPTLRLLCSISGVFRKRSLEGGTNRAHWEDVTDSTPLTFVNDCVSFTTTVSARYWLMDCRNVGEATKMATELYREAIHVPFMARFIVYAKRTDQLQAKLRIFCVTDDKEDKTLEKMERFTQVAKSKDVEVHEGKPIYLEFGGNFTPVAKSGDQPKLEFRALRENRLQLETIVRGTHADAVARCQFMREPKRPKGEPPQTPICVLNILLPEEVFTMDYTSPPHQIKQYDIMEKEIILDEQEKLLEILSDEKITSICNLLGMDWVPLAYELGISSATVANIRERGANGAQQAALLLQLWKTQGGLQVHDNSLELALCRIGREDVLLPQSEADTERRIQRNIYQEKQSSEEIIGYKSPDSELIGKDVLEKMIAEEEDINKALYNYEAEQMQREMIREKDDGMDDSIGDREEAKYSPEEKSYVEDNSDREPSLSISEESEEEEGVKKSVAERKIQITRKLSSGKIPASKQKRELKEEIIEIKKQINPEIKRFHEQQTAVQQQEALKSFGKTSRKSSEEEEFSKKLIQSEAPKEKILPKAPSKPMQKHVRNESMIRFSSGDFSDVKVPQQKQEKISETKDTKTVSKTETKKEIIIKEKDIAEASLKEKISSFENKMLSEKTKLETDTKIKVDDNVLKHVSEQQKSTIGYTESFIKDQKKVVRTEPKQSSDDPGSPDLVSDFASELMKAEETFRAAAEYPSDKYTENYYKIDESYTKTRTDSTIVQFSSEEDSDFLKKSTDSETESQITVKQHTERGKKYPVAVKDKTPTKKDFPKDSVSKIPLKIPIGKEKSKVDDSQKDIIKEQEIVSKEINVDRLHVDSLEDSLQISSDEEAQVQPTDDESESQPKDHTFEDDAAKLIEVKYTIIETKEESHTRSDSMGSDFSKKSGSEGIQIESTKSPKHASQDSPLPYSQSTIDKTDSLADSVHSTERDMSYITQTDSKVYSKESRATRSDSLDEASQFSDMEETQIGSHVMIETGKTVPAVKLDTMMFLEQEVMFSSRELSDSPKKVAFEEPAISSKARQFIETVPEDESSVQECFFSKRIYSDSLEESEQYGTDNDSRRPSEADSLKSDRSDQSARDSHHKMSKIASDIEESADEGLEQYIAGTATSVKNIETFEVSDLAQEALFKKMGPSKRHVRNESISIIKFSSAELRDSELAKVINIPPEIPQRGKEFQMLVTQATDDYHDEQTSSSEKDEVSDKISSESSREIEISDRRSDKISSEDAVTDKASSESMKYEDSVMKVSTDTLLGADARSPDLVIDESDHFDTSTTFKKISQIKLEKDRSESIITKVQVESAISTVLEDIGGKRMSDAHSLTDSRDYTFEESEDSLQHFDNKREIENKAKAILEPIYDKALRTIRGDSLDDVEPFCLDQESETPHLPGIQEQVTIIKEGIAAPVISTVTVTISPAEDEKAIRLPITRDSSKNGDKDYSVHSSPDEVEEKICTDTESELDQAKVLEIIEPTSEDENGFMAPFDTRKLKQDSLDDADDLFAEKEGIFEDIEELAQQQTDLHITTYEKTASKIVEDKSKKEEKSKDEVYMQKGSSDKVSSEVDTNFVVKEKRGSIAELITDTSSTLAASVGLEFKPQIMKSSGEKKRGSIVELLSDASSTLAASVGVDLKPEDLKKTDDEKSGSIIELLSDASSTLAASVGVELKPEDLKGEDRVEGSDRKDSIVELLSDASSTLAASVGVELKPEDLKIDEKEQTHHRKSSIVELLSDASSTLAATVGVELKHEDKEYTHGRKSSIVELISDASSTLAATAGVKFKPDDHEDEKYRKSSIVELLSDASSTLAASVGVKLKSEDLIGEDKRSIVGREGSIAELLSDASSTLAASIGVEFKHEDLKSEVKESSHGRKSSIVELLSDASSTLAATAGVKFEPDDHKIEKTLIEGDRKGSIVELLSDASSTLAASVGVELKPEDLKSDDKETVHGRKGSIVELLSDASSTLAASVGVELKHEDLKFHEKEQSKGSKSSIKELLSDASSTLAASVGVKLESNLRDDSKKIQTQDSMEEKLAGIEKVKYDDANLQFSPVTLEDTGKIVSEIKDLNRSDRRCSDLLEDISQPGGSVIRIDSSQVSHGLSLKFSKTPPPSPVDLIHKQGADVYKKGSEDRSQEKHSTMLSPEDAKLRKDFTSKDSEKELSGISETQKSLRSSSPKSPTRSHTDNITFINVDTLTVHPEKRTQIYKETHITEVIGDTSKKDTLSSVLGFVDSKNIFKEESCKNIEDDAFIKFEEKKQEFSIDKGKKLFETFASDSDSATTIISTKESTVQQISGKEVFTEKRQISSSDDESIISAKIETKREISGEEYKMEEKETFEKTGETVHSEKYHMESDQKALAERKDSEIQRLKLIDDDSTIISSQKEFTEQGFYSGRQSKSEEKMTSIKDEVSKKAEVSYSERDISHEQWGKEYFTEKSDLDATEKSDEEFLEKKDACVESSIKVTEKDEKLTSEEISRKGKIISSTTGFSKEEFTSESKEYDDKSYDASQDSSYKSESERKQDSSYEKSDMSPKSKSRSLKKEEIYEVDFIKELKVSTSQKSKGSSQEISLGSNTELDLLDTESGKILHDTKDKTTFKKADDTSTTSINKVISPVLLPEEHIHDHTWEVSLQQQEYIDETTGDLLQQTKPIQDEPYSMEMDFPSHSEPKSLTSGSDLGVTTITSDFDIRVTQSGTSITSSDDTYLVEQPSDTLDSLKDSMIKSRESIETEYMIKSLDSQDTETLHKSMDSVSAEITQQSDKEEFPAEIDLQKKSELKLIKEKSLEDICSSGYDTDLSSTEFLISKLELERVEVEQTRPQPLADLSDLEKTIDEVKQSLEAAHDEIINEKCDGTIKYKQSPSEFEFKLYSPDRPEIIHEEPLQYQETTKEEKQSLAQLKDDGNKVPSVSSEISEEIHEVIKDDDKEKTICSSPVLQTEILKESDSDKQDETYYTSDDEKDTAQEKERFTQQEFSDISGLESGPISLLDTETELISDKEDSHKDSLERVKLRPIQKHLKTAHMTITDRKSASDIEGWSSSGESHYQSFEHTDSPHSRPLSSDVEVLLTGTADFHSALTTQDLSTATNKSQRTSKDYVTAASSLSSRESVKSLDSVSSEHIPSLDISDASETLVPSAAELREEMTESGNFTEHIDSVTKDRLIERIVEEHIDDRKHVDYDVHVTSSPEAANSNEQSEEISGDDEINDIIDGSTEIVSKMKRSYEMSFQPKELLPEKFPSDSFSESTDLEVDTELPESDSQVFSMSKIETGPSSVRHVKESTDKSSIASTRSVEPTKSYEISEKIVEYRTSSVVYKTPEKKLKPVGETIVERKVITVKAEPQPTKYAQNKSQEIDFKALEACIIPHDSAEFQEIISKSQSSIVSEKKSSESYPIDSKQSSASSLKIQDEYLSTPQTPISNPSQSSESTENGREYILDEMYEISEDPELSQSVKALTDSKSELSVTTEERTLYETHKVPESPSSEEFEIVDKPGEMDDFVVIEEVAKEASELDAEGKSLSIAKVQYVKKHDEEIEKFLSQTAKKTSDTEYSTSGSLSEEEILQYELEQKKLRAQENAEIEAGKRWIQMQFEGDLAAARYDYDRGPLEDIKEEEMTDFDASRIGSFQSQKESVGSYGSMKNSYGSMSESDLIRKRYIMRSGDQDDVSVSSLQEFENLEQILSMEAYQHSSSSQDSLNGSLSRRYHKSKTAQGDDVSMSSLKEFEGLENACLEALKIEIQAKQKEALLLSQDGRLSSSGFLEMEKRSYSLGSSESSPPQKSGSSPGQKSGSPSQKSGSPSQKSGSPGQKGGSPGQKFGSPSQKSITEAMTIKKLIDQQITDSDSTNEMPKVCTIEQKKKYDSKGAFYVPNVTTDPNEDVCVKKTCYECLEGVDIDKSQKQSTEQKDLPYSEVLDSSETYQHFENGKNIPEKHTSERGMDIPGAVKMDPSEDYGSGSFTSLEIGSGTSAGDYGSEFSSSITSQQSDTESLVTMMEKPYESEYGTELGSLESITVTRKIISSPQQFDISLNLKAGEQSDTSTREISPLSGKSGSGVFSSTTTKHHTDPTSSSWSGMEEDMSSSSSFSRVEENEVTLTSTSRLREEDLMLGSTDSLEQTSSNATRATYNYEVDTPMTGSLTSAGSNTMVSSLDTLEPVTALFDKGEKTFHLSTEDCFTMDHSGSDHLDDGDNQENGKNKGTDEQNKPQAKERTVLFEDVHSSDESSGKGATFFIGSTPITKGEKASTSESDSSTHDKPPIPAQRKSLTGSIKSITLEKRDPKDDSEDEENV